MDQSLLDAIARFRAPFLDSVFLVATVVGIGNAVWFLLGAIGLALPRRRMAAWRLVLAVAVTYGLVDLVIKPVARRERPAGVSQVLVDRNLAPTTYSFPSGHAAGAVAGALAASRVFPTARVVFWLLAFLIAFSRLYFGVHWPSDVIAGALFGLACGWFVLGGRKPFYIY